MRTPAENTRTEHSARQSQLENRGGGGGETTGYLTDKVTDRSHERRTKNRSTMSADEEEGLATSRPPKMASNRRMSAMKSMRRASVRASMLFARNGPEHDWFIRRRNRRRHSSPDTESLEGYQQLLTDQRVFSMSIRAIRLAVFADTLNSMVTWPNYALMALPGSHPDSFPSTAPFAFSAATYFIPLTGLLGMAIAGVFAGKISDKIGRKPVVLFCLAGSMFGSALKWFLRSSFWPFCIANLVNGLLSGTLPVALAYSSDLFSSEREKSKNFTAIVGLYVIGQSIGGIFAILMQNHGLFAPLWAGVAILAVALVFNIRFLIEPGRIKIPGSIGDDTDDLIAERPEKINTHAMANILIGGFVDVAGSKALFPLCMTPLAFDTFYRDFVQNDEPPIMSLNLYKWLTVLISVLVVPSSIVAPKLFDRFGMAAVNVFGNFSTGVITVALLFIGNAKPATRGTFAAFVCTLYLSFPFSILSQLAISPMLDRLSPKERKGVVMGSFTTVLNCANAVVPWLLGLAIDVLGTTHGIWIGVGLSGAATLINLPLVFRKEFKPAPRKEKKTGLFDDLALTPEEEEDYIQKALKGEHIPARVIQVINMKRLERGEKFIVNRVGTYKEDHDKLGEIVREAKKDIKVLDHNIRHFLGRLNDGSVDANVIHALNKPYPEEMQNIHHEIGEWFGDYIKANGYIGANPLQNLKLMIIRSVSEFLFASYETVQFKFLFLGHVHFISSSHSSHCSFIVSSHQHEWRNQPEKC